MRRITSLIITLTMLMTVVVFPSSAFADENDVASIGTQPASYVNPIYEDVINEEELVVPMAASVLRSSTITENGIQYHTTLDGVAATFRDKMEERQGTIILYYKTNNYDGTINLLYDAFDKALIHTGSPTEGDYLQWQYGGWGANISGYIKGGSYYLKLTYVMDYYTTASQEKRVDAKVDSILDTINIDELDNDYLKVKAIYDYICSTVSYDYARLNDTSYLLKYTAYAAAIDETAVCQGYALLFYRLVLESGIDARLVPGDTSGGAHGWNIVEINDLYYNLDSTWDAGRDPSIYGWFLLGDGGYFDDFHKRWPEWDTVAFNNQFPMSKSKYTYTPPKPEPVEPEPEPEKPVEPEPEKPSEPTIIDISSYPSELEYTKTEYDGSEKKPKVTVKGLKSTDYTVQYENNINPGTALVTITGKGNYTGTITKTFTIKIPNLPAPASISLELYGHDDFRAEWSKVKGATGYYVYYKEKNEDEYDYLGKTKNTSYRRANLVDGDAYMFRIYPYVVINDREYKSDKYITSDSVYALEKVSALIIQKKSSSYIRAKWKNIEGEDGYQIARSTKQNSGYVSAKAVGSKFDDTTIRTTRNKTYYYKIRAYVINDDGEKIYGPWSSVKSFKLR